MITDHPHLLFPGKLRQVLLISFNKNQSLFEIMSFKYRLLSTHVRRLIYVSDGYNSTYIIAVIDYYFSRVEESLRKTRKVIGSKCFLISVTEAFYLSFFLQNKLLPNQANKEEFITSHTFWVEKQIIRGTRCHFI